MDLFRGKHKLVKYGFARVQVEPEECHILTVTRMTGFGKTSDGLEEPCASPKLCPPLKSTAWAVVIHWQIAIALAHVGHHWVTSDFRSSLFSHSPDSVTRKPSSSATVASVQTQAPKTSADDA